MNMKKTGKRIIVLLISLLMMTAVKPSRTLAEGPVEISDAAQLQEIVSALNADGGAETVVLTQDVSLASGGRLNLTNGELTILGGGHALNAAVVLQGTAVLNLGSSGYGETLSLNSSRSDLGVVNIDGTAVINIYDGVTIGPCSRIGTAGGITANGQSRINMYGGTITGCSSASVAGGVYLNGNSVFNLSGGTIKDCTGVLGGAVGLSGGSPLGGSAVSSVQFNMSGGLIENCTDQYIGGGAVCAWTAYPIVFNLSGGEIRNCRATSYGYGGGICLYTTADTVFQMTGGTITGCSSTESKSAYGGGVFVYAKGSSDIRLTGGAITGNSAKVGGGMMIITGNVTIADGFGLHNNSASAAADDIFSNGTNVTLGTVDTSAVLQNCGHSLTGWYKDNESRWNYSECTGQEDHLELFTDTGTLYTSEYGLKAAHGILAYTVTWVNDDGSVLETDTEVPLGSMPEYNGDTPVKAADAQYTYTFEKWTPDAAAVTGDATYTAVYSKTLNTYTVTWKDDDGSVLETDENVPYGSMPEYNGDTPAKAADAQYTYTFEGWSPEVSAVTGDVSYTAVYSKILNTYTVTWKDDDGSVLESDTEVPYGSMPEYNGYTPAKAADAQYTYTFENWTPEAAAVTGDATYTAVYSKTLNTYTVTWRDDDGSVLETDENVPYGTAAEYSGGTPVKAADDKYTYTFAGWYLDGELYDPATPVTKDIRLTAKWNTEPISAPTSSPTQAPGPSPRPAPQPAAPAQAPIPVPPMNPNPVPAQGQAVVPLPATTPSATPEMTAEPAPTPSPTATSEVIADEPTPQVAPRKYWALTNLIAAVVTVLICLITCLTYFRKNSHDDEEDEENDRPHPAKFLTLIPAILSIFLFTLTEDMRLPWKWVDKWTLWMILLLLAAVILAVLTRNRADRDNAEEA